MLSKAPAFHLYANDWLSSTKITLMTPAQEGAYIRLLCVAWNDPDCSIPDNDEELSVLSRLGEGWFTGGSTRIRTCFEPHPEKPGRLVNMRLLEERAKLDAWREKSRAGGVKSGESRRKPDAPSDEERKGGSRVVKAPKKPDTNQSRTCQIQSQVEEIQDTSKESRSRSQSSRSRRSQVPDEKWLEDLQANPAYQALDVKRVYAKMSAWCGEKGKQPTRMRLVNWLNREDVPLPPSNGAGSGRAAPKASIGAPLPAPDRLLTESELLQEAEAFEREYPDPENRPEWVIPLIDQASKIRQRKEAA